MHAHDLGFGSDPARLRKHPDRPGPLVLTDAVRVGHTGPHGPAITPEQWPRGPLTGLPMAHVLTVRVPEGYRTQGPDLVGIAFFQGEGQFADQDEDVTAILSGHPLTPEQAADPFLAQLAGTVGREHPRLRRMEDIIGGQFALLWLTEDELSGTPCAPPEDVRLPDREATDEGPNAWDDAEHSTSTGIWMGPREGDPNVGLAPENAWDDTGAGYRQPEYGEEDEWSRWCDAHEGRCHFGGTVFPIQALPKGLGPRHLEIEEFGPLNFGGGNAQIDLENDVFDWACG
ncbi:hypothetical protein B842_02250 [Corynebacterium humireducens NBRC 106098 = DSM 45392]|uniref:DUF1963 domain-containing protein n=1 Tax=Corynebacterium humireducens NBRC 106098 = DSM 45392 TaxID=1223515 RepID=A0A0B5D7S1_9CORY|nr:hypothetical protein [Corynebacterium humireducens]AJE32303.1 hypothetical protein B842_02250 [Corynebacterium humireducens NBRC 106098 = DSM 45392]